MALASTTALVLCLPVGAVQAQTASAPPGAAMLEEVIVTAQKRAENVQDIAAAITPVNTDELLNRGGSNLTALQGLVPNVEINTSNAATGVAIRGIFSTNDTQSGDPAVAFHIDGVYVGRPQSAGVLFFDLDRIEVLRGPQGTLYGRNATAGAINVISRRPTFAFDEEIGAEAGSYNLFGFNGMLNAPLSDTLAVRAAFRTVKRDGYATNGADDQDQAGARVSGLYQPTDSISLLVAGDYDQRRGVGPASYRLAPGNRDPRSTNFQDPSAFIDNENWGVRAELNWDLDFAALTVLPAYHQFNNNYRYASDRPITNTQSTRQKSIEVRLASPPDQRLSWILGAFYWKEEGNNTNTILPPPNTLLFQTLYVGSTSAAVFGQATFTVTDKLRLTGGLRYTEDEKRLNGFNRVTLLNGRIASETPSLANATWDATNWKASVEYDIAEESMLYATAATGYKAGGMFDGLPPNTYEPENLLSFEIGSKNRFFNNALQLNIDAFYYLYEDYHATQLGCLNLPAGTPPCTASGRVTYNAKEATVVGVEVEGQWAITANDRLNFTAAYTDGKFEDFVLPVTPFSTGGDFSGNPLPKSARYQAAVDYSHRFDLPGGGDITANARLRYTDEQFLLFDISNPIVRQAPYTMADAAIVYTAAEDKFSVSAYVNNIGDELIKTAAFFSATGGFFNGSYLPPRTYGVKLNLSF